MATGYNPNVTYPSLRADVYQAREMKFCELCGRNFTRVQGSDTKLCSSCSKRKVADVTERTEEQARQNLAALDKDSARRARLREDFRREMAKLGLEI